MLSRQSLIEVFAAFIEFQADRFSRWVIDPQLRRSMEKHQSQLLTAPSSASSWSLYWHTLWRKQPDSLARSHLSAYLQDTCYWTAQKAFRVLTHTQYSLSDCCQLASAEIDKVLTGYDPNRGAGLKSYARLAYPALIRDILRQRQEADICTAWTLLRRLGKKRLVDALRQAGLSTAVIAQYRLAWVCYKTLYGAAQAPTRKPRKPSHSQWRAISTLYNRERLRQLTQPGPPLTPTALEQRLHQCVTWVREYTYPPLTSLNTPSPHRPSDELQDELSDPLHPSLMADLIAQEEAQNRQLQQSQLNAAILTAIGELATDSQTLLRLYYHQDLTQQQIALQLDLKQYTVSRRLARTRETLLSALMQWSQDTLHISPTPDLVTNMSLALEGWLTVRYRNPLLLNVSELGSVDTPPQDSR